MFRVYCFPHLAHHLLIASLLLTGSLVLPGCATDTDSPTTTPENPLATVAPEFIPVVRYGRYTLVELAPMAAQRDLLLQVIDVSIPNPLHATVGDGLRHVLQGSGYQLCNGKESDALEALPLPAAHYHLGPLVLRDALSTLVGSAWDLHVDKGTRQVCFTRTTPISLVSENIQPSTTRTPASLPFTGAEEARP